MGQPGQLRACLILLMAVMAIAQASAAKPVMFADFLSNSGKGQQKVSVASASGYNNDELEQEVAFLQTTGTVNCQCIGCADSCNAENPPCEGAGLCCATSYIEANLGCSKESPNYAGSPHKKYFDPKTAEIGSCEINEEFFDPVDVEGTTTVWKEGVYTLTCTLHAGAHTCGHPFCEDLILTSQGAIYWATDIVSRSDPAPPKDDCWGDLKLVEKAPLPMKHKNRSHNRQAKIDHAAGGKKVSLKRQVSGNPATPTLFVGSGYIYSGPMYIVSRHFDVKYESGWLDYYYSWTAEGQEVEAACEDKHQVHPYQLALKFSKPQTSTY